MELMASVADDKVQEKPFFNEYVSNGSNSAKPVVNVSPPSWRLLGPFASTDANISSVVTPLTG